MLTPPFKLSSSPLAAAAGLIAAGRGDARACCEETEAVAGSTTTRARLAALDPHLHCSIIGTCLGTADLRKLMARFIDARDASDLHIHHETVSLSAQGGVVTKTLNKALDQRHAMVV